MTDSTAGSSGHSRQTKTDWPDATYSQDIILYVRYPDGKILHANQAAVLAYGYSHHELLGLHIHDLRAPETHATIRAEIDHAASKGLLFETEHRRKDGSCFPVEVSSHAVEHHGAETILLSVIRDISERKQTIQDLSLRQKRLEALVEARSQELERMYERLRLEIQYQEEMERLLQAREETFLHAFHNSTIGKALLSATGQCLDVNTAACRMLGFSREEILHMQLGAVSPPDDSARTLESFGKLASGEIKSFDLEKRYTHKDGREIWAYACFSSVGDINGRPKYILIELLDITKRKETEARLRESEETFRSTFHHAAIGMVVVSLEGHPLHVNPAICDMLGYSENSLKQMHFVEFTFEDDAQIDLALFGQLTAGSIPYYHIEKRYVHATGRIVWGLLGISLIRDDAGQPLFCVALVQDITKRKAAEAELAHAASIVETSDNAIYSLDMHGNVLSWNPAAERMFGYAEEEIRGKSVGVLIPEDKREEYRLGVEKLLEGSVIRDLETKRLTRDGRLIDVRFSVSPIKNDKGEVVSFSSIARDITRQKALEREITRLDRLDLVAEMAASISHEVRNPMTTVRGYLQMLGFKDDMVRFKPQLDLMISELDRMNEIITEFLSLGRNKATEMRLAGLNDIIDTLHPLLHADAMLQGKGIKLRLTPDLPKLLLDQKEIRQLVLNLVRNGMEAMSSGGELTIATYREGNEVVLSVEDQGSGIPEQVMEKLATPFFSTKENGTGLGLSICFSIARRHNAIIVPHSGPWGTRFDVRFQQM